MATHKDPKDRAHHWEREPRPDEVAPVPAEPSTYPHELPRHLHKANGEFLPVATADECEQALASGWSLLPPA